MFGFEDLGSEVKDRFVKDRFWSAAFVTFGLCNYDVLIVLASELKYAEKIAVVKYTLADGFYYTVLLAVIVASLRTLLWPFVSTSIRYHLLRINEKATRQENLLTGSGAVDARNVMALVTLIHQNRNHNSRVIEDIRQLKVLSTDKELKEMIGVLEIYNASTFGNIKEICQDLKINENDLTMLINLLNPELEGYEKPTDRTWESIIKKLEDTLARSAN